MLWNMLACEMLTCLTKECPEAGDDFCAHALPIIDNVHVYVIVPPVARQMHELNCSRARFPVHVGSPILATHETSLKASPRTAFGRILFFELVVQKTVFFLNASKKRKGIFKHLSRASDLAL